MEWQYSDEGPFEAWVVGRSGDGEIELVWCDQGLGERAYRWGAILVSDGHQGMDSQWHARLMDAAISVPVACMLEQLAPACAGWCLRVSHRE